MASLRRNKTLSPDGQTARFLYTIIKQLDLKAIDWNLVAGSLEITNGHAARMRYSRFKQHMEGATTQPRAPRTGKKEKEGKEGKDGLKKGKKRAFEQVADEQIEAPPYVKNETGSGGAGAMVKRECGDIRIKNEQDAERAPSAVQIKSEPGLLQDEQAAVGDVHPPIRVKREPKLDVGDSAIDPDIWHILPRASGSEISLQDQTPRSTVPTLMSTAQPQPPLRPLHQFAPAQSTVSLAELEVSPRFRAPAIVAADAGLPRSSFTDRILLGERKVLGGSASNTVQIKAEPMLDVDWMVSGPGKEVMVKSEPVET